jgi:hypothetical protein
MKRKTVRVHDKIQRGYTYELVAVPGRGFAQGFEPELSPAESSSRASNPPRWEVTLIGKKGHEIFQFPFLHPEVDPETRLSLTETGSTIHPANPAPVLHEHPVRKGY